MLKYHIKVTDNETGEIVHESNRNCIIAGLGNEKGAAEMCIFDCDLVSIVGTVKAALFAIERMRKDDPEIEFILGKMLKERIFEDE